MVKQTTRSDGSSSLGNYNQLIELSQKSIILHSCRFYKDFEYLPVSPVTDHFSRTINERDTMQIKSDNPFWTYLFKPQSLAVIGASDTLDSWGYNTIRLALSVSKRDKSKRVYAVNPKGGKVLGTNAYASILDIPDTVDLAIIVVRAEVVPTVFRQCVQKGVKAAVVLSCLRKK